MRTRWRRAWNPLRRAFCHRELPGFWSNASPSFPCSSGSKFLLQSVILRTLSVNCEDVGLRSHQGAGGCRETTVIAARLQCAGVKSFSSSTRQGAGLSHPSQVLRDEVVRETHSYKFLPLKELEILAPSAKEKDPGWLEVKNIGSVCSILHGRLWTLEVKQALANLDIRLTPYIVYEVLKRQRDPQIAFQFFEWAKRQPTYRHDTAAYTRMVMILGASEKYEAVQSLVKEFELEGCQKNLAFYNALVEVYSQAQMVNDALQIFESIKGSGLLPTTFTYKCIVHSALRSGNLKIGADLFVKMMQAGYMPDNSTINMLIDAVAKTGQARRAYSIFREMIDRGYAPDVYTYTIIIRSLGQKGHPVSALKIFRDMLAAGIRPTSFTYHSLIHAFGKKGKLDEAVQLVKEMRSKGHRPGIVTYNILMDAYAKAGKWSRALEVFEKVKSMPDAVSYNSILDKAVKNGDGRPASQPVEQRGADKITYAILIRGLSKVGRVEEACKYYEEMKGLHIKPDASVFNNLLDCLGKRGQIDLALKIFQEMKEQGVRRDVCTYNILINRLCKAGRTDLASKVSEEMAQDGCVPGRVTYNCLINNFGKANKMDDACKTFLEMQRKGVKPDVVTYTCLVDGFFLADKVDSALYMFQEMKKVGCLPNVVTYNVLIDHLTRKGRIPAALNCYQEMKEKGVTPDLITETILGRLPNSSGSGQGGSQPFSTTRAEGVENDPNQRI